MRYLILMIILLLPVSAMAQSGMMPQHLAKGKETGFIRGTLVTKNKKGQEQPVREFKVAIMVFYQGQRVLILDKTTDKKGRFEFKNIFKDADYVYALGAIFKDKLFIYPNLSLDSSRKALEVRFQIGEGSPHEVQDANLSRMGQNSLPNQGATVPMSSMANPKSSLNVSGIWKESYQKVALFLSVIVIFLGGLYAFRKV